MNKTADFWTHLVPFKLDKYFLLEVSFPPFLGGWEDGGPRNMLRLAEIGKYNFLSFYTLVEKELHQNEERYIPPPNMLMDFALYFSHINILF